MEELKIGGKVKEGYMGGYAWTGCNYNGYMSYGAINKLVKKAFKSRYKDVKVSCTGSSYSGGQSCDGTITTKLNDTIYDYYLFVKNCKENGYYPMMSSWYYLDDGSCEWGEGLDDETRYKATYNSYVKSLCSCCGERLNRLSDLDKSILKPEVIEMVEYLNALYDSFNDVDVNGMVDYFDVLFYKDITLKCVEEV